MPETAESERYQIGRELARGGMGAIHEARDLRLSRTVAVKQLLVHSNNAEARLKREALLTARLQHPAIVPIFDVGALQDGGPFYAMKLVDGMSLEAAISRATTLESRLTLLPHVVTVVEAVAFAHSRGIVHRDLKPHNVLVGEFGETVVVDWGLAREVEVTDDATTVVVDRNIAKQVEIADDATTVETFSNQSLTKIGTILGTPTYMAPEQAAGDVVDTRADVYALGAMLYHLLSGRRPRPASRTGQASEGGRQVPLSQNEPRLPTDLVTIVEKAMAESPAERYSTAGEMAADLRRFQTGQLVGAHHYTAMQLIRRLVVRHPTTFSLSALAAVAMIFATAVLIGRQVRVRELRETKRILDGQIVALENAMGETYDSAILHTLEDRLDTAIARAEVASHELTGAGISIARGDDAFDRRIHDVLAGFNADTYSIPPRFRNVVAAAVGQAGRVRGAVVQNRKRSVWPIITRELDSFGLPQELAYLALMESDLNASLVFSPGDAAGLWQLKSVAAREHGLRVDKTIDERLDPMKSTHVAAEMLADMFAQIGDDATLIAVMAYPLGVENMRGFLHEIATEKGGWRRGHRSYWHFYRTHRWSKQMEDYVARLIALMLADRSAP